MNDENESEQEEIVKELLKKQRTIYILIIIIVAVISAVASSEYTIQYYNKFINLEKAEASENSSENINNIAKTLKDFRKIIDLYYLGEVDEQKILDETIKGYVNGLDDEYSEYMTADEWDDFQANTLGNYVGIGIYMGTDKNGNVKIVTPIKGTPAEEAGIQSEDIIVKVDDKNVLGISVDEVSSMIKGEEGTKVKITVARDAEYKDFEITRTEIKVYHVESKMLENNIGYMELYTFDDTCSSEFKEEYEKLKSQGAKKIILDLRSNTGGLVNEALSILDMMLPKDAVELITTDSKGNKKISKSEKDPIITCDMVVLVNEYSASASEITVGALKDNNRAKIVGKTTYGKGVIQTIVPLKDKSALKITTNEYFTPNETKINKVGITPDFEVDYNSETEEDEQLNKAIELLK